jgi:phosphoenolpyruvate carboxykinase (ATP)
MIDTHNVKCWLVNTGWTGGSFGVGQRIKLAYTRAMVNAALNGDLDLVEYIQDPIFGLQVPTNCPEVPDEVLQPRNTWQDPAAYDRQAQELATMFASNFTQFADHVSEAIRTSGPVTG